MTASTFLPLAHRLADAAGEVLRRYFRAPLSIQQKTDSSLVTQADHEVEAAMRAILTESCPDHGIFGEEGERVNPHAALQWVLDPIDGTSAFIAGYPTFTTLIALVENGVPVLGLIDQPILRERWVGIAGQSNVHKAQSAPTLAHARIATTSLDHFTPQQRDAFVRLRAGVRGALYGGDAYAYAMLAAGQLDAVVDGGMKPYDFCALVPVVESAGGVITDWRGAPLTLNSNGDVAAAANAQLHAQLLATLS